MDEQRRVFTLTDELRGDLYRTVLLETLRHCDRFSLVKRHTRVVSEAFGASWSRLSTYLLREQNVSEWPGTRLLRGTVVLREYALSDESARVLADMVNGVYDWRPPDRPEDLVLWALDRPWLVIVAHERYAYFELTPLEYEALVERLPELFELLVRAS